MPQSFWGGIAFLAEKYAPMFLKGAGVTLLLAIVGTVVGFLIGLLVAIVRTIPVSKSDPLLKRGLLKVARGILVAYIEVFRSTPMMVQAMVIYYGVFASVGSDQVIWVGMFIISINTGAYMAEIVRGGVISIDVGQTEGAQSIGMTHWQTMTSVVLPQAIRNILPSVGNEFVVNIKDSSVLSVISISEVFFTMNTAAGAYLRYFEAAVIACVIYFIMTFTITRILHYVERKMDGPENYVIHGSQTVPSGELRINENEENNLMREGRDD